MNNISFRSPEQSRWASDVAMNARASVRTMRQGRRSRERALDVAPQLRWLGVTMCAVSAAVMLISATLLAFRF